MRVTIFILLFFTCSITYGDNLRHGEVKKSETGPWKVWDADIERWSDLDSFWLRFANENGGLTWGRSSTYPNYSDVKEFDKFLVEVKEGTCLMEFFHTRWRRANDVRRWDPAFNEYSGCPHVFD